MKLPFPRVPSVELKQVELVRGGKTAPPVPMTIWDQGPGHMFVRCAWFFEERVDPARVRAGLARALHHFPMLAGRLRSASNRGLCIDCNDAGALFREAYDPHPFGRLGPDDPGSERAGRYIEDNPAQRLVDRDRPLTQVQVTHLATGGSIVGVGVCHVAVDAESYFRFVDAIARACRGEPIDGPSMSEPSWESAVRALVARPEAAVHRDLPVLSVPRLIAAYARLIVSMPAMQTGVLRFTRADVDTLKAEAASGGGHCSTNDVVTSYVWRVLNRLRGDDGRAEDRMHWLVNTRGRLPLIPPGYFGNAATLLITSTPPNAPAREPFAQVVRRMRGTLDGMRSEDFAESFCGLERCVRNGTRWRAFPLLVLDCFAGHACFDSWAKFGMYQVDFGAGRPRWVFLPTVPIPRFSFILPSGEDGGVDVHLNLHRADMAPLEAAWRGELDGWRRRASRPEPRFSDPV